MRNGWLFRTLALGISSTAVLLVLEITLRALPVADPTLALAVGSDNPVPRLAPDRDFTFSKGWNFSIVAHKHTNNYGFLSDQQYVKEGPRPLLAVIGDSYVEAMQIPNSQSFPALLGRQLDAKGRVYPFGLSGTALPSYLAFASFASGEFGADAMVFTIIGNDFDESLMKYAYQPRNHYFVDGPGGRPALHRLDYTPSRLKQIARKSALIRYLLVNCQLTPKGILDSFRARFGGARFVSNAPAEVDPERLRDSRYAIDAFFALLPNSTHLPTDRIAFLVDGVRPEMYDPEALEHTRASYVAVMREYFIVGASKRGYDVIDLAPVFEAVHRKDGLRFEFPTDNHWNAIGHRVAAGAVCRSEFFARIFGAQACEGL